LTVFRNTARRAWLRATVKPKRTWASAGIASSQDVGVWHGCRLALMAIHRRDARQGAGALDTVANSVARRRRWHLRQARFRRRADSDREALAAFGATGIDDSAPTAGAHPFAKTVRALAFHDRGLIGAFGSHVNFPVLCAARISAQNALASSVSEKPAIRRDNARLRQTMRSSPARHCVDGRSAQVDPADRLAALGRAPRPPQIANAHYRFFDRG
jgi:hypothetical protein